MPNNCAGDGCAGTRQRLIRNLSTPMSLPLDAATAALRSPARRAKIVFRRAHQRGPNAGAPSARYGLSSSNRSNRLKTRQLVAGIAACNAKEAKRYE